MKRRGNDRGKNVELCYTNVFNIFRPFVEIIALFDYIIILRIREILKSWLRGSEGGCWVDYIIL